MVNMEMGLFRIKKTVVKLKQYVVGYAIPVGAFNQYGGSVEIPIPPNSIITGITIAFNIDIDAGEVKTVKLELISDDGSTLSREYSSNYVTVVADMLHLNDSMLYLLMGGRIDESTEEPVGVVEVKNIVLIRAWARSSIGQPFKPEIYIRYYTVE
jgi:hypothetical protein